MKKCCDCKQELDETCFHKNKNYKDGLQYICKNCVKEYKKRNQSIHLFTLDLPKTKVCTKCGIEKPSSDFSKSSSTKNGLQARCKYCISLALKQYIIKNGVSRSVERINRDDSYKIKHDNAKWVNSLVIHKKLDSAIEFVCAMESCTKQAVEYHHLQYDSRSIEQPFSIIAPLCKECHTLFHIRERDGIDLTDKILTQIEIEYIPRKPPHIRFIKEKV